MANSGPDTNKCVLRFCSSVHRGGGVSLRPERILSFKSAPCLQISILHHLYAADILPIPQLQHARLLFGGGRD